MKKYWEEWKDSKEKLGFMFWLSAIVLALGIAQWLVEPAIWIYKTSFRECIKLTTNW
jgi:hypothetical protein